MKNSTLFLLLILIFLLFAYITTPKQSIEANEPNTLAQYFFPDNSIDGIGSIPTSNYANLTLKYYYYIPKSIVKNSAAPYLIMVPGLNCSGQDFVTQQFKDFAKREGFVIISPSFMEDDKNFDNQTSYQFPRAWSGQALNDILNSFNSGHNMRPSRIYMLGFSAGAQFVSRYAMLYPDYVTACAFNAPGGTDDPLKYQATKFYVAVGNQDEDVRKHTAQNFCNLAQNKGIDVTFKEYENLPHQLSQDEINDELAFFHKVKSNDK